MPSSPLKNKTGHSFVNQNRRLQLHGSRLPGDEIISHPHTVDKLLTQHHHTLLATTAPRLSRRPLLRLVVILASTPTSKTPPEILFFIDTAITDIYSLSLHHPLLFFLKKPAPHQHSLSNLICRLLL